MKVKLGDVCDRGSSNLKQSDVINQNGQYPVYGAAGLLGNIDLYHQDKPYVAVVKDGAGIGRVTLHPGYSSVIGTLQYLLPKENVLPEYLYYVTKHMHLEKYYTGATIPHIYFKDYKNEKFNLDAIEKQQRIVDILKKTENIIESRQQELQKLDDLIRARFVELFGDQTTNPYGWQQASIGACCTLKSGTSLPADKENEGGAIPYVKVGDMNYPGNEQYITTSSRFVSEQTAGTGVFPVGTVVFPKRGGAIGTNKKRLTRIPICADLNVMGVTASIRLTPQYLMAYFNNIDLGTLNNGSSVPQINNKDIAPLLICIPPMALQEQFAAFVAAIDKSKATVQKALDETQLLFDSLMQQYFG